MYKVPLHPKLDNNSASRIVGARKTVRWADEDGPLRGQQNANEEGGRRWDDEDVPLRGQQNANKAVGRRWDDEDGPLRGQQNANKAVGRRWDDEDGPLRGQQNANEEGGRRWDDEDVLMNEEQNADYDWEPIDRFHVSGKGHLGNLHNVHSVTSNELGFMHKKSNTRSPTEQKALKPYNDSIEEYILLSIQDAERLVVKSDREADRKLQMEKLKGLEELLSLYNERKKLIEIANATISAGPKVIKAEDVTECFEELCKLPIFGPIIKQMYKVEQKTRKDNAKEYKEEEAGTGFMPKPSRNKIPGNRGEQYLNDLEQQSLLNSYAKKQRENELLMEQERIEQQKQWQQQQQYYGRIPVVSCFYNFGSFNNYGCFYNFGSFNNYGCFYNFGSFNNYGCFYNFARPSSSQPPQQPQQQKFESFFSSDSSSTSRFSNNRFNGRTPSNGNQNQSRFGQRPMERQ
uniref:Uncharacterized protein n=1 Tax=Globodera rostochiensis TaxID=31243 RepID=A0A914HDV4_GLORO